MTWCLSLSPALGVAAPTPVMPMTGYLETQHDQPYVLAVCAAQGRLDYLGVAHTLDANSEAVQLIRAQYQRELLDSVMS